ncbi:MAG: efflux RND transporter periplasmic adaptor subunit [Gammaproteobacteria bacterium]|nr:efflux RND transporter periplasmic adaptor subunit [Gammaproteobacteria bacterium]HXK57396.1 efflux RND transporter periplasmic adaptor subunit [Gammaproteobacteria bacterium]
MRWKIGALFGAIVVAGAVYWWQLADNEQAAAASLVLYGNIDIREVRLAFNGNEHVSEILVDEGDRVEANQLLARLHSEQLQAAWERASADVAALEAEAHAAALSYQRIKTMAARKLASVEEADEAEGKSRAAAARVAAAQAVVKESWQALEDAELFAPVDGVIRERIVEPGDFVTPQTPVLTLTLLNPVWVRTYLPEMYLGKIKPGAVASITTDSFPDKVYTGWVGSISPTAEFTPKNVETPDLRTRLVYQVRVFACNPQFELRLGMPATVSIDLDQATGPNARPEERCAETDAR